jgi:serine/threonine protein kinase
MADPLGRLQAALVDTYRVERELGQGGMATVYLAHDRKHDRKVAIKVLRPDLAPPSSEPSGSWRRSGPPRTCNTPTSFRCSTPGSPTASSTT